ncbi:MAG: iron-containing alcohol dehydrogenase [Spirochaetaceae bacterium]
MKQTGTGSFEFATAGTIRFGYGISESADSFAVLRDTRVFLVTGSDPERHHAVVDAIRSQTTDLTTAQISGEPDTVELSRLISLARSHRAEAVVSIGGGSVLDAGKATAALLTNRGDLFQYLEIIGKGQSPSVEPAPFIALPTTAGTGSEVTRNAVIHSTEHGVKVSMRSQAMLPTLAIVDPGLCLSLPVKATVFSGMDAATQLIEAFTSRNAHTMTDAFCKEGLRHYALGFEPAVEHAQSGRNGAKATDSDRDARAHMCLASLFSGLALANAKLGAVHGIAGPVGGMTGSPHGALCASLLPEVTRANILRADHETATRYETVAGILFGPGTSAQDLADRLSAARETYQIPGLNSLGLTGERYVEAAEKAVRSGSMKGNPVEYTVDDITGILERSA